MNELSYFRIEPKPEQMRSEPAIRNGIIFGYKAICEGLIKKFKEQSPNLKVVATGGNAKLISTYSPLIKNVDEDLALKGLEMLA